MLMTLMVVPGKPDDWDAGPGIVPQGEEVDDGGDEQATEQHPDGQARHVPCYGGDGQDQGDGSVGHMVST